MNLNSLDFFYNNFADEQMNFLYTGNFTDEFTERLIELNDYQFVSSDKFKSVQRRSAFLIAECFQNIVRHSDTANRDSYFHIKNAKGKFSLISGNTIKNNLVQNLKIQLEQLNKLTSEELKEVYRKTLIEGSVSEKGGAGLGLIEMARKTNNKLNFSFSEINALKSYFYFQLLLNTVDLEQNDIDKNFHSNIFLREVMLKEDLFLAYKGNISTQVTGALLGILEQTFNTINIKLYFIKWMSFLEKVSSLSSSAGHDNSIMLLIAESDNDYKVGTTCYLSKMQGISLERALKLYKSYSTEKLQFEKDRLLKAGNKDSQNEYHLFLIELLGGSVHVDLNVKTYNDKLSIVNFIIEFEKGRKSRILYSNQTQETKREKLTTS